MATITQSGVDRNPSHAFSPVVASAAFADVSDELLANAAIQDRGAPKSLTGCVSVISSFAPVNHSYTDALKQYAEVYEEFQAYLAPEDSAAIEHDYDQAIAMSMPENSHFGCINDDMVEYVATMNTLVSDAEIAAIEDCGYLGWLHH